jgi:hypothetical protein
MLLSFDLPSAAADLVAKEHLRQTMTRIPTGMTVQSIETIVEHIVIPASGHAHHAHDEQQSGMSNS